jgi:arginyl-tRNA synthetase
MQQKIISLLKKHTELKKLDLEIPPSPDLGDYSFPCFQLAKTHKKNPAEIASDLAKKLPLIKGLEKILPTGPYLNFFLDKTLHSEQVLRQILKEGKKYGSAKNKEKIMVEFSGPNPFKAFHIGHLRNTVLGESLTRILKFQGYTVISVNYLNDTGTHVSKCIWGLENLKLKPKGEIGEFLGILYSLASKKINTKSKEAEVQEIHKQIENKNPKYIRIWKKGVKDSSTYFNQIYKDLDVKFNKVYYDSNYINKGKEVVEQLQRKKIAKKDEGAIIVNLEKYNLNKVLVLKSNETALYITKDLAMAMDRLKTHKLNRLIYVVGSEQKLHFKQVFKILELSGFKQAKKCRHISYELVMLPEGRMASRKGKIITYSEVKNEILDNIRKETHKRHKNWSKQRKQKAINLIFSSAIKFDLLKQGPEKIITFSPDKALEFEGDTGPYIQYTHARICSILRKERPKKADLSSLTEPEETALTNKLSTFPKIIKKSTQEYKPYLLANYLLELSRSFNEFYHKHDILKSSKNLKQARLNLISATKIVLNKGLNLLAIKAPEEM